MSAIAAVRPAAAASSWQDALGRLAPGIAARAARADETDAFVEESLRELREAGVLEAGVPRELGGGGATLPELGELLRELAHHCSSTALALSMHTHMVANAAWRWRHMKSPVEGLLKRISEERLQLLSSGGSDWLSSSGEARRVEGGFRVNARKGFSSGAPSAALFMTSAVYADPQAGPSVLHFGLPMNASGVSLVPSWKALGMRGTGSHDVVLDDVFVPDAAVSLKRPQHQWHALYHVIVLTALPLIYSVYVGVAEAARERALALAGRRRGDPGAAALAGALDNELHAARIALADMMAASDTATLSWSVTARILAGRTLVARAVLATVDAAMTLAGGSSFYRERGLERLFRDAQACRYHPYPEAAQREIAGRLALGMEPLAESARV